MKKIIGIICILSMVFGSFAVEIETTNGQKLSGKIVAKRIGVYSVETAYGELRIPVNEVKSIIDGKYEESSRYAKMTDWGIESGVYNPLDSLSIYEREHISQLKHLNANTKRNGNIIIGIASVFTVLGLIGLAVSASQVKKINEK